MHKKIVKRQVFRVNKLKLKTDGTLDKEVKLSNKEAYTLLLPADKISDSGCRHLLDGVTSDTVMVSIPENVRKIMGWSEVKVSESVVEQNIWDYFYEAIDILVQSDPYPTLIDSKGEYTSDPSDYRWGLSNDQIKKYSDAMDKFYSLFSLRFGYKSLTPYMVMLIYNCPQLLQKIPFGAIKRFSTEGGEHLHYMHQRFYYQHTQREGSYKTTHPAKQILLQSYKEMRFRLVEYCKSSVDELRIPAEQMIHDIERTWASSIIEKYILGKIVRRRLNVKKHTGFEIDQPSQKPTTNFVKTFVLVGRLPAKLIKVHKTKEHKSYATLDIV